MAATTSAFENVLSTLKNHAISELVEDTVLEGMAKAIVSNLCITHDRFPKW